MKNLGNLFFWACLSSVPISACGVLCGLAWFVHAHGGWWMMPVEYVLIGGALKMLRVSWAVVTFGVELERAG